MITGGVLARLVVAGLAILGGVQAVRAEWYDAQIGRPSEGGMFGMARGKYGPIMFHCWDDRGEATGEWLSEIIWATNIKAPKDRTIDQKLVSGRIIVDGDFYSQLSFKMILFPESDKNHQYIAYHVVHSNFETLKRLLKDLSAAKESVEIRIGDQSAKYSVDGLADAVGKMLTDCGIKAERYNG